MVWGVGGLGGGKGAGAESRGEGGTVATVRGFVAGGRRRGGARPACLGRAAK
eukprot:COSAG01_NODE_60216_length_296_cov_0.482234_1_plen_51_part_01